MRIDGGTVMPLLVAAADNRDRTGLVRDPFLPGLAVAYTVGPPFGERLVGHADLNRIGVTRRELYRGASGNLRDAIDRVRIHGQPPALMLSFDGYEGLESSALLEVELWEGLRGTVPGELVVGAPARDVVIVTGSWSKQGMEKARRAVDRVFFAGDDHLLSRDLLVWRRQAWEVFRPSDSTRGIPRPSVPPR